MKFEYLLFIVSVSITCMSLKNNLEKYVLILLILEQLLLKKNHNKSLSNKTIDRQANETY